MNNFLFKILDNTACYFYSENDYFVLGKALTGYSPINKGYVGYNIPYLCRGKNGQYEIGIGEIAEDSDRLIIKKLNILSSSDNNNTVNFEQENSNTLYCFANSYNFRTAFNNIVQVDNNFTVENTRSTYIVNINKNDIEATLPSAEYNKSLVVEFQTLESISFNFFIKDSAGNIVLKLKGNSYAKLISTGYSWIELKNHNDNSFGTASYDSSKNYSILNTEAAGTNGSIQYNNNGYLEGANVFYNGTDTILLGSNSQSSAHAIIPVSGSGSLIFNNSSLSADFLVKGSGDKNLFFANEGRLGINIPSGSRPQTALHIVNNACQDSIRLENRNPCYSANLTLYHKPTTIVSPNSIISTISLSAKNSVNNQVDFVQLKTKALSSTAGSTSGEFIISTDKLGNKIDSLTINPDMMLLKSSNNNSIKISTSGIDINGAFRLNNSNIIDLFDPGVVVFTGVCI